MCLQADDHSECASRLDRQASAAPPLDPRQGALREAGSTCLRAIPPQSKGDRHSSQLRSLADVPGSYETMQEVAEVLTADEAADLLRVSTKTVLALAREGTLPGEKVGRAWRFVRADLLDYVRGQKNSGVRAASQWLHQ